MFYLVKMCCEARGRTIFQITDYYATISTYIVCKILNNDSGCFKDIY